MKCTSLALGFIGLACLGGVAAAQRDRPVFRVVAAPTTVKNRSAVRLSVTNVSDQDQLFWSGSNDCTNTCWQTNEPAVLLEGTVRAHTKTCMMACVHHITLRPNQTYRITFPLDIAPQSRKRRRTLKFAAVQPPLELLKAMGKPQNEISPKPYTKRVFWSAPVVFNFAE